MTLMEKIEKDVVEAMKARDAVKVSALRMLKSAVAYYLIQSKKEKAEDSDVLSVLARQAKQRRESLESFEKAGRMDLAEKEKAELKILASYLPKQLTDEEIVAEVQKAMAASGAKTQAEIGKLMKVLMPAVQGKADGRRIQEVVKNLLPA